jgi:hypothetical protein
MEIFTGTLGILSEEKLTEYDLKRYFENSRYCWNVTANTEFHIQIFNTGCT